MNFAAVDEPVAAARCAPGSAGCMRVPSSGVGSKMCQTNDLRFELGRQIARFLGGITLVEVVERRVKGRAVSLVQPGGDIE